jgi:hypothetical protein
LNVDAFITRINLQRNTLAGELDHLYLASLSDDAVPELVGAYQQAAETGNAELSVQLAVALACYFAQDPPDPAMPWQSWNSSRSAAQEQWKRLRSTVGFPVIQTGSQGPGSYSYSVIINGDEVGCWDSRLEPDFP